MATICVEGDPQASGVPQLFKAVNGRSLREQPIDRIVYGRWGGDTTEGVVVCRTSESTCEIHCHGGDAAVRRICADLRRFGCQVQTWQDLHAEPGSAVHSELTSALAQATTLRAASLLLNQFTALPAEILAIAGMDDVAGAAQRVERLLTRSRLGLHLVRPWCVVLTGRPNVGKSSLLNALAGFTRAIVFDQPGTTRDTVSVETAFDGWPVRMIDTAGLRAARDELERHGVRRAREQLKSADCRLIVIDSSRPPHATDRELIDAWPEAIIVAGKADLADVWGSQLPPGAVRVSAVTGAGLDRLIRQVANQLVDSLEDDAPIPVTRRQIELLQRSLAELNRGETRSASATLREIIGRDKCSAIGAGPESSRNS